MKKFYLLMMAAMTAAGMQAQTYSLEAMTASTFEQGGDAQWSFQKYEYGTGAYTSFSAFGPGSTCNFLDYYNPERLMGEPITSTENYTGTGINAYVAGNVRKAWYDQPYEDAMTNPLEKFIYFTEDGETYAQTKYAGVVSFTVPEDGYYVVSGTIVREDCPKMPALYLIPRFRYQGATQLDSTTTMGLRFAYGDQGGMIDGVTNYRLDQGANQRYVAQTPVDYTFAFQAKQGDVVSFETNGALSYSYSNPRDCWGRSFFKKLDVEKTDSATATANANYVNPYNQAGLNAFRTMVEQLEERAGQLEIDSVGEQNGMYKEDDITAFLNYITTLYDGLDNGSINAMNVDKYIDDLKAHWTALQSSKYSIDLTAEGNYILFSDEADYANYKAKNIEQNDDTPWGYYNYNPSTGLYTKFSFYGTTKGGVTGWARNGNEWMYVQEDGMMHPLNNLAPAIVFTAPEEGYYQVGITARRTTPNPKVENPLYLRARYVTVGGANGDSLTCARSSEITSVEYGSVAHDGQQGKAPVSLDYFVHLKQGDKISLEEDAYTSGRNASAGTLFTRFTVARMLNDTQAITKSYAEASGQLVFDPYKPADLTALSQLNDSASTLLSAQADNIGTGGGQYSESAFNSLSELKFRADNYLSSGETYTQTEIDNFIYQYKQAIQQFIDSRNPYEVAVSGKRAIRVAGTDKYLVQKNLADDNQHWYATFTNYDGIAADTVKNHTNTTEYQWTWTFNPHDDGGYYLTTEEGWLVTNDGYVSKIGQVPTEQYAAARLSFYTENEGDSLVAIKRLDGKWWNTSFGWHSPYDKVNTSSKPVYSFILCDAPSLTPAGYATGISDVTVAPGKAVSKTYYTIDGQQLAKPVKGIVIERSVDADGHVTARKLIVR